MRLAVVTADRPRALERCLSSLLDTAGDEPILVADGSRVAVQPETRAVTTRAGAEWMALGEAQRHAAASVNGKWLERSMAFALDSTQLPAIGANRNAVLLRCVGRRVLTVDDDVVWAARVAWRTKRGLRVTRSAEPRTFRFDNAIRRRSTGFMDVSVPIQHFHENLGKTIRQVASHVGEAGSTVEVEGERNACLRPERVPDGRIRLSMSGYEGHDGMGWPTRLLWLEGAARAQLLGSESIYRRAYTRGWMSRHVDIETVSLTMSCMTMCIGFDGTDLLPPFFPWFRNSDALYAVILRAIDPGASALFTTDVAMHEPLESRIRSVDDIWRHASWRTTQLIAAVVAASAPQPRDRPAQRLRWIGRHLCAVARSPEVLRECVSATWHHRAERVRQFGEEMLERYGGSPEYWAEDVRRYLAATAEIGNRSAGPLPVEASAAATADEGWRLVREWVERYGELLQDWPAIWQERQRESGLRS